MNFFDAMRISASGLSAQRFRMGIISSNMANANTTRTPEGGPYQRKDPVVEAAPLEPSFRAELENRITSRACEVRIAGVAVNTRPPVVKYDPQHPDADERGYVGFPNINLIEEMVNMMSAARSYEANVTATTTSREMVQKALEIGR
jgi:flagellar basal-body rod protein FlgC